LKELNTEKLPSAKPHNHGTGYTSQYFPNDDKNKKTTLESLCRPVFASSEAERPNAICMTFFPARNILGREQVGA
jgi:hypothetical protein